MVSTRMQLEVQSSAIRGHPRRTDGKEDMHARPLERRDRLACGEGEGRRGEHVHARPPAGATRSPCLLPIQTQSDAIRRNQTQSDAIRRN